MALITQKVGKDFVPHPITDGAIRGVIVDVTPPVVKPDQFHPGQNKTTIRFVYETEMKDAEGKPCFVWSKPMGLSFAPPGKYRGSELYLTVEKIIGRDIKPDEGFDDEQVEGIKVIGKPVKLIVEHTTKDGETYANITYLKADTSEQAYKSDGSYIRKKDRKEDDTSGEEVPKGREYAKAATVPDQEPTPPWSEVKVHVGQYAGHKLGTVPQEGAQALIDHWIPTVMGKQMSADDRRLYAALREVKEMLAAPAPAKF